MTPDTLAAVGQALFGSHWQEPMADALLVSSRTVRYWIAGREQIPIGIWGELRDLIADYQTDLSELYDLCSPGKAAISS